MSKAAAENIKTGAIKDYIFEIEHLIGERKVFILTDSNTHLYLDALINKTPLINRSKIFKIEAGENSKTLKSAELIWKYLIDNKADRNSLLINFGGGMITDLGGFVASTFKRGIQYINVPTSLLSMVDASVGGKTGVNLNHEKNQIGTFSYPKLVICDPELIKTQSKEQILSGFAEVLKHGLIANRAYWIYCTKNSFENLDFNKIINESIKIKAKIVDEDPLENGIRKVLNFGHTIGHAIETLLISKNNEILHGHAIAAGIYMESFISHKTQGLSKEDLYEIQGFIKTRFHKLPFEKADIKTILEIMKNDKKRKNDRHNFSLISSIGKATYDNYIDEKLIELALMDYLMMK